MSSTWDRTLLTVQLKNVQVQANSMIRAWDKISSVFLLRSVLFVSEDSTLERPFSFEAAECSARELFNALTSTYKEFTWTQDERTGVVWFHPTNIPYAQILPNKLYVPNDQFGLPMQTGILEPLGEVEPLAIRVRPWGTLGTNTFNYSVDVPQGNYTLRDLLNLCCVANPSKTFFLQAYNRGFTCVTAVSLCLYELTTPPVGALHYWETELGPLKMGPPTTEELMAKLADPKPAIRSAARNYLNALVWQIDTEKLVQEPMPPEKALWVCLGVNSVHVRTEEAGAVGIQRMKAEATEKLLMKCNPGLAVLTATELCRLTKETWALDIISRRSFSPGQLSGIVSDAWRIARASDAVWNALRIKGASEWLGSSEPSLRQLGNSSIVPKKLEFWLI